MSDSRAIDRESRRRIREELLENILVEAGAGSGKTQMLAERMAAGVAAGVYQVEHMAAVTFTRKAASELRGRFHLALEGELVRACAVSPGQPADPGAYRPTAVGAVESGALLRRDHSLVLRAPPARAAGRIGRVAGLHRARRGAGSRAAPTSLAGVHHERARRRRPRDDGAARGRHPPAGSGFRVREDLRQRGRGVSGRGRRVPRSEAGGQGARGVLEEAPKAAARVDRPRTRRAGCSKRAAFPWAVARVAAPARPPGNRGGRFSATWDRKSDITQKWWADDPSKQRKIRLPSLTLHSRFPRDGRRAVSRAVAPVCVSARDRPADPGSCIGRV